MAQMSTGIVQRALLATAVGFASCGNMAGMAAQIVPDKCHVCWSLLKPGDV